MTLAQVRRIALSLPEATEEPHFHLTSFRVRGKIFATAPPEGTHLHLFVNDEVREATLGMNLAFVEPLLWGKRVAGLKVTLAGAIPGRVTQLLSQAWAHKAPKTRLG